MRFISQTCRVVWFATVLSICAFATPSTLYAQRVAIDPLSPDEAMSRLRESPYHFTIATLEQRPSRSVLSQQPFSAFVSLQRSAEGDGWTIYVDEERPYWLAYGACLAIWESDASYRADRSGGDATTTWLRRESECLVTMLESYDALSAQGLPPRDERVEELRSRLLAGSLDSYLLKLQRRTHR